MQLLSHWLIVSALWVIRAVTASGKLVQLDQRVGAVRNVSFVFGYWQTSEGLQRFLHGADFK